MLAAPVSTQTSDGKLPQITVNITRVPPYANLSVSSEEREAIDYLYVTAVIKENCATPDTPWECNTTGLNTTNGANRALLDPTTGMATFPGIELSSDLISGDYEFIFFAESYPSTTAKVGHRWGTTSPPELWASRRWPVAEVGPITHVQAT